MILARLSVLNAIFALVLIVTGVVGAHQGIIAPMTGFLAFLLSFVVAILALLAGLAGLAHSATCGRRPGRSMAGTGVVLSLLVAVPVGLTIYPSRSRPHPNINDFTTDYDHPPQFVHPPGLSADSMKYDRARLEPIQRKYYPKLAPLRLDEKPDDAFAAVEAAANVARMSGRQMTDRVPSAPGWFIAYIDPTTRTIEGVEISRLFRFRADFVIQVRPGSDSNSLVEMRSRSRDGTSDFGADYNRIREFFAILKSRSDRDAAS